MIAGRSENASLARNDAMAVVQRCVGEAVVSRPTTAPTAHVTDVRHQQLPWRGRQDVASVSVLRRNQGWVQSGQIPSLGVSKCKAAVRRVHALCGGCVGMPPGAAVWQAGGTQPGELRTSQRSSDRSRSVFTHGPSVCRWRWRRTRGNESNPRRRGDRLVTPSGRQLCSGIGSELPLMCS